MKTKSKTEAKQLAKAYSYNDEYKDTPLYIIYCNRTKTILCRYQQPNKELGTVNRLLCKRSLYKGKLTLKTFDYGELVQ
ncbi:hypothetical protein [Sphingobacterium siyangense]|uniref:Uncharacterized protein n=1 Tax=Sphingobacterium siyangense TaxID=459529 RepID=A0A562MG19_9SPHI|nr:hypothetical protein [Sphingobacterium siyangense]TWI18863.1 hypothetical protein IQ31_02991 [Sphingobacterium siyangense]